MIITGFQTISYNPQRMAFKGKSKETKEPEKQPSQSPLFNNSGLFLPNMHKNIAILTGHTKETQEEPFIRKGTIFAQPQNLPTAELGEVLEQVRTREPVLNKKFRKTMKLAQLNTGNYVGLVLMPNDYEKEDGAGFNAELHMPGRKEGEKEFILNVDKITLENVKETLKDTITVVEEYFDFTDEEKAMSLEEVEALFPEEDFKDPVSVLFPPQADKAAH
ncbi:MAG: hypothetical protein A2Y25_10195 [Candidatus Melainabacteria bacterium GWF2_37_15]|nr:MAG: hypothetical protein A2Y25_10195 [Candidatus Melainabacteria bacterium GWF2_37_15]